MARPRPIALWVALLGTLLASLARPAAAWADSPYQRALERALTAHAAGDFTEARTAMEEAHALEPSARTHRGLGVVAHAEGRYVAAVGSTSDPYTIRRADLNSLQDESEVVFRPDVPTQRGSAEVQLHGDWLYHLAPHLAPMECVELERASLTSIGTSQKLLRTDFTPPPGFVMNDAFRLAVTDHSAFVVANLAPIERAPLHGALLLAIPLPTP